MTILDRSDDGLVLTSLPDGSYAWLRPETPIEIQPVEIKEATPADLLATPARFMAWLNAQPADATVGLPRRYYQCPIARFLENEGFVSVAVGSADLVWSQNAETVQDAGLPKWATRFVDLIDVHDNKWPVRASHARALLDQACKETGLS